MYARADMAEDLVVAELVQRQFTVVRVSGEVLQSMKSTAE